MSRREQARLALRQKFLGVARERIAGIADAFDQYDAHPEDDAQVTLVMREIHTLKGESKLVGLDDVHRLAHAIEDLVLHVRVLPPSTRGAPNRAVVSALDALRGIVDALASGAEPTVDVEAVLAELARNRTTTATDERLVATPAQPEPRESGSLSMRALLAQRGDTSIRIDLVRLHALTDLASTLMLEHDRAEQELLALEPLVDAIAADSNRLELLLGELARRHLELRGDEHFHELHGVLHSLRARRAEGRLLVGRARDHAFEYRLRLMGLETQVRDLRLQPLAAMFRDYPRAVRELSDELGKKVRLEVEGADVELDKQVLERLAEPLLHLIRNALDHGVEKPDERRAAGKPETATLTLAARQRGPFVEIRVSDDGRGIDVEAVRRAVVKRGVMAEAMARARTDDEIRSILFEPGFSTRDVATTLSGRGVGLDVVKSSLTALGGEVRVESTLGVGTTFTIAAPIAMVYSRALLVTSGEIIYAIPSESVRRVVTVQPEHFEALAGTNAVRIDGSLVPSIELGFFSGTPTAPNDDGTFTVVVVDHLEHALAVVVDRCTGERPIVQRALDRYLSEASLVAATAVLNSGELAVLVDVGELVRIGHESSGAVRRLRDEPRAVDAPRVLLVDDSEITRDLLATILRARGFEVEEAENGVLGFEAIARFRPSLVVTDLEMPELDGFGLLERIRGEGEMTMLPVVVFSTRGSEADKRRAAKLGADAYLVKGQFKEDDLVSLAQRYAGGGGRRGA